ncbi:MULTISPECIES: PDR/VanB family oxidoreductase [unclassified Burkholderia]|uniref:PDR/VanB family oxidoreductase n=1 Tax=unclassified Burkholderia TaxID=2613784 RepID=UPI002AAF88AE|nr:MULTISPECIES: PDR/VanB family oxidoreductase [unclassified Burkholderia]
MQHATLDVKVLRKRFEAEGIASFELGSPDGTHLPSFSAGAHIDVFLPNGMIRQYSLCNAAGQKDIYQIAVLRDQNSRGGSVCIHDVVQEGQVLKISEPRNHFPLANGASHSVLIAGGIGVTPILSMAERLSHAGASFEFHYCTRNRERTAFLDRISESLYASRVRFHFDDGPEDQRFNADEVLRASLALNAHLYVCGPGGFLDFVLERARDAGWSGSHLHREYFTAAPVDCSQAGEFEVELASTGKVIPILPEQTVVEVLATHGVEIPVSCEQGVCGTCITRVLSGEPDHRDMFMTDEEHARNDQFTPCCSRSKSGRLVLDL